MPESNEEKKELTKDTIEKEFFEFLQTKGYDLSAVVESEEDVDVNDGSYTPIKQKPIRRISEDLNKREWNFEIFSDTRTICPGLIVYVIEQIAPNEKTPYVTYRPEPRIITEIQDNGVNNGAVFFTYSHKFTARVPAYNSKNQGNPQVISEPEVIYSPLTKDHATYICKLLNLQSKQTYMKNVKQKQVVHNKQR